MKTMAGWGLMLLLYETKVRQIDDDINDRLRSSQGSRDLKRGSAKRPPIRLYSVLSTC